MMPEFVSVHAWNATAPSHESGIFDSPPRYAHTKKKDFFMTSSPSSKKKRDAKLAIVLAYTGRDQNDGQQNGTKTGGWYKKGRYWKATEGGILLIGKGRRH